MANLQIKNVPEELHAELRRRAEQEGKTLRDYVLDLIRKDQAFPTMKEWLADVRSAEPVELDESAYEAIEKDRAEHDRQLLARFERHDRDSA